MSDSVLIDKNRLESYEEVVSALRFAMRETSGKSAKAIKALKDFLLEWLGKEKYQKSTIDAQNFYFSKKMAEQAIAILEKNVEVSPSNVSSYVKNALAAIDLDSFFFLTKDVKAFEKKIKEELQTIVESIAENTPEKAKKSKSEEAASTEKTIDETVKKNLHVANVKGLLNIVPNFLEKNVFTNIRGILKGQAIRFDADALKIVNSKTLGSKNIFTSLYVPDISRLYKRFKRFEYNASRGIVYKTKAAIKRAAKRIKQAIDFFFPFGLVTKILKTGTFLIGSGIKIVKGALRIGIGAVSTALNFAFSTISFATKTILKIGSASISLLSRSLQKIGAFKLLKLTAKGMFAFLKTYAGAYLLGYVVGSIYRKFHKLLDFAKGVLNVAKVWFEEHIYIPWLEPIFDWFQQRQFSVYADLIIDQFESSSLAEGIDGVVDLFKFEDSSGRPLFDLNKTIYEFNRTIRFIKNNFTAARARDLVLDNLYSMGGGALGSLAGAKFGAALGALAFGPIGAVAGGIIGSLLLGWAGEKLGTELRAFIKDNSSFQKVEKHGTQLEIFSREYFGLSNRSAQRTFFHSEESPAVAALQQLANDIYDVDLYHDDSAIRRLRETGVDLSIEDYKNVPVFKKSMELFKNIGRFSYENVYNEIESASNDLIDLVNKGNGVLTVDALEKINAYKTPLVLTGSALELSDRGHFNPLFFRIFRAIAIQKEMENLAYGGNPMKFVKTVTEKFSDPSSFVKYYEDNYNKNVQFGQEKRSLRDLIFFPENKIIENYFIKQRYLENGLYGAEWKTVGKEDTVHPITAEARLAKFKAEVLPFIAYVSQEDKTTGAIRSFFLGNRIKTEQIGKLFEQNAPITDFGKNIDDNLFANIVQTIKAQHPDLNTLLLNKNEIAAEFFRIYSGGAVKNLKANGSFEDILTEFIVNRLQNGEYKRIDLLESDIGKRLQQSLDSIEAFNTQTFSKSELEKIAGDPTNSEIAYLLREYDSRLGNNTAFIKDKLLPFLQAISEKGMSSEEMGHIFGFVYNAGSGSVERYEPPTADTAGVLISPNVG